MSHETPSVRHRQRLAAAFGIVLLIAERASELEAARTAQAAAAQSVAQLEAELSRRDNLFDTLKQQVAQLRETVDVVTK